MMKSEETEVRLERGNPSTRAAWEQRLKEYRADLAIANANLAAHKQNEDEHEVGAKEEDCAGCREYRQPIMTCEALISRAVGELENPKLK